MQILDDGISFEKQDKSDFRENARVCSLRVPIFFLKLML
jgi:hypothetical protein